MTDDCRQRAREIAEKAAYEVAEHVHWQNGYFQVQIGSFHDAVQVIIEHALLAFADAEAGRVDEKTGRKASAPEQQHGVTPLKGRPLDENGSVQFEQPASFDPPIQQDEFDATGQCSGSCVSVIEAAILDGRKDLEAAETEEAIIGSVQSWSKRCEQAEAKLARVRAAFEKFKHSGRRLADFDVWYERLEATLKGDE